MRKTLRCFVSSTRKDLEDDHRAVVDHIRALGLEVTTMSEFSAEARSAVDGDAQKVGACDLFVLILAHRYGEIPTGQTKSYTELEYEAARSAKLPRFLFLVDEDKRPLIGTGKQHNRDDGADWRDRNKLLEALKLRIRERNEDQPTWFAETTELTAKVVKSLRTWTEQHGHATEPGRIEAARPPAVTDRSRRDSYLQQIRAQHSQLPLIGFPKTVRIDIPLEDLYVPLHAVPSAEEKRLAYGAAEEAYANENLRGAEPCTSLAVVFSMASRRGNRRGFVLLGDPGAGKTTHLRRMALACAMPDKGPRELGLPDDVLPLFLPLRLLKDDDDLDTVLPLLLARSLEVDLNRAQDILRSGSRWLFLFDGLDEVPKRFRDGVARWIERLLTTHGDSWFGVTSRYAGYADDCRLDAHFLELHLRPLRDEAIAQFVHNWYRIVERQAGPQDGADPVRRAADHAKDLIERLTHASVASRRVEELAANPLLLTIICLVHRDRGRILPDSRIDLYQDCMAVLLERWREAKGIDATWTAKEAQQILQPLALQLHEAEKTRLPSADLAPTAAQAIRALHPESATDGAQFLAQIRDESGVLVGWSNDQFGFLHLGFQEHLAAKAIADSIVSAALQQRANPWLDRLAAKFGESWWEEVLLLLLAREDASLFVPLFERIVRQPQFAEHGSLLQSCLREAHRRDAAPFRTLLAEPEAGWWLRASARFSAIAKSRLRNQESARALAKLAIAAISSGTDMLVAGPAPESRNRRTVKGIELLELPAGSFRMGAEGGIQRVVTFARPFWMARTAVTNAQYRVYVDETKARRPDTWKDRRFNGDDQPVLDVSWDDAQAFCKWAGLRLPSEAEWEYACRAGTTTAFSFGDNITPEQGNYDGNYPDFGGKKGEYRQRTVAVGSLPANAWGLHEMHGNVWEWCEDWLGDYSKAPSDGTAQRKDEGSGRRVLRGGSWFDHARGCRSASRDGGPPGIRDVNVGFRPASSSP